MAAKVGVAYIDVKPNFDGFERAARKETDGITSRMGSAFAGAGKAAAAAFVGVGALAAAGGGFGLKIAADMEQAQVAFTTMLGSADAAKAHLGELKQFAAATPFSVAGVVNMSQQLQAMGFTAENVMPTMRAISDSVSATGGGEEQIQRVTNALGQMQLKGKVSAEEMLQLSEAKIPAWDALAAHMGLSVEQVQKLASEGKISDDVFLQAFNNMEGGMAKFKGATEAQSQTLQGMFSTLKDTFSEGLGDMALPLAASIKDSFPQINQALGDLFAQAGPPMAALAGQLGKVFGDLIPLVTPILSSLAQLLTTILEPILPVISEIGRALGSAFTALMPALLPLAQVIGDIFARLGGAIAELIPDLVPILTMIADVLVTGLRAAQPILDVFIAGFSAGLKAITPILQVVADVFSRMFERMRPLIEQLVPVIIDIGATLGEVFSEIADTVGPVLMDTMEQVFDAIAPVIPVVADAFKQFVVAVAPLLPQIAELATALLPLLPPVLELVADVFGRMYEQVRPLIEQLVPIIVQIGEKLGEVFSRIAETVGPVLMDTMSQVFDAIAPVLPAVADAVLQLVDAFAPLLPQIAELATAFLPLLPPVLELVANLMQLMLPILTTLAELLAGALGLALKAVTPLIEGLVKVLAWIVDGLNAVLGPLAHIGDVWDQTWAGIQVLVGQAWETIRPVFEAIWNFITVTLAPVWDFLGAVVQGVWQGIQTVIGVAWSIIEPIFQAIWNIITVVLVPILQNLWNIVSAVFQGIGQAIGWVWTNVISPVWDAIVSVVSSVLVPVFQTIGDVVSTVWNAIGTAIGWVWTNVIQPVWNAILTAIDGLKAAFGTIADAWSSVWNGIKDVVTGIWNTILDVINGAVNGVIGIINGILDGINSVMEPLPGDWTPLHIEEVHIAGRAKGGPVASHTPYLVGEAGPELFVPPSSGTIVPNGGGAAVSPLAGDPSGLEPVLVELVAVLQALTSTLAVGPAGPGQSPVRGGDGAAAPIAADPATMAAAAGATQLTTVAVTGLTGTTTTANLAAAAFDAQMLLTSTTTMPLATLAVQTQDLATQALALTVLGNVPVQAVWQQTLAFTQAWLDAVTAAVGRLIQQLLVLNATAVGVHVDRSQVDQAAASIANLAQTVVASMAKLGLDNNVLAQWLGVVLALPAGVIAGAVKAESGGVVGVPNVGKGFATSKPTLVGEGSRTHREWVIPTDPKWRSNSLALLGGLHRDLGVDPAAGGFDRDQALRTLLGRLYRGRGVSALESGGIVGQTPFGGLAAGAPGLLFKILAGSMIAAAATAVGRSGSLTGDDWQAITHYLDQVGVPYNAVSTVRPGARTHATGALSYHATGDAVDLAGNLMEIWAALDKLGGAAEGGTLQELIYSMAPTYIGRGTHKPMSALNPVTKGDHYDHVHAAIPRDAAYAGAGGGEGGIDVGPWEEVGRYIVDHFTAAGIGAPAGGPGYGGDVPVSSGVGGQWTGKISNFGGPGDYQGTAYDGNTRDLYNRRFPYAAMRLTKGGGEIPLPSQAWIRISAGNGRTQNAQILDWGPARGTGKLVDVAPYVESDLGVGTGATVTVSALEQGGMSVQPGMAYVHDNEVHLPLNNARTIDALAASLEQAGAGAGGTVDQRQYHFHEVIPTAAQIADEMYWREFVEAR